MVVKLLSHLWLISTCGKLIAALTPFVPGILASFLPTLLPSALSDPQAIAQAFEGAHPWYHSSPTAQKTLMTSLNHGNTPEAFSETF